MTGCGCGCVCCACVIRVAVCVLTPGARTVQAHDVTRSRGLRQSPTKPLSTNAPVSAGTRGFVLSPAGRAAVAAAWDADAYDGGDAASASARSPQPTPVASTPAARGAATTPVVSSAPPLPDPTPSRATPSPSPGTGTYSHPAPPPTSDSDAAASVERGRRLLRAEYDHRVQQLQQAVAAAEQRAADAIVGRDNARSQHLKELEAARQAHQRDMDEARRRWRREADGIINAAITTEQAKAQGLVTASQAEEQGLRAKLEDAMASLSHLDELAKSQEVRTATVCLDLWLCMCGCVCVCVAVCGSVCVALCVAVCTYVGLYVRVLLTCGWLGVWFARPRRNRHSCRSSCNKPTPVPPPMQQLPHSANKTCRTSSTRHSRTHVMPKPPPSNHSQPQSTTPLPYVGVWKAWSKRSWTQ